LDNNTEYIIKVRAHYLANGYRSSSNEREIQTNFVENPDFVYLSNISVVNEEIILNWLTEDKEDNKEYKLYRAAIGENMSLYKTLPYISDNQSYTDKDVDVGSMIYNYQVSVIDVCDNEVQLSNISSNILLILENNNDGSILNWNLYKNWDESTKEQIVFEELENTWGVKEILGAQSTSYASGLRVEELKGYEKCFYIESIENDGNKYNTKGKSKSNIVCITGDLLAHWPNAIIGKSNIEENSVFIPKGKLINFSESEIEIYDRWGGLIFYKKGIENGWDASINGNRVPIGIYYYNARLVGKNGNEKKFKGLIQVVN
jgi:gliding motility-associated-like protein